MVTVKMGGRNVIVFYLAFLLLFVVSEVEGTLTPSNPVPLDCGSQQTFTCSVTGTTAGWTITGFSGITAMEVSGQSAATKNARITTTDTSGVTPTSTITITGFTTVDNGGTVHCINQANTEDQGVATVYVGVPDHPVDFRVEAQTGCTNARAYWAASGSATSTNIFYCQSLSANCESVLCSSSPCTISGLMRNEDYNFTAVHTNNCGNSSESTLPRKSPLSVPDCSRDIKVVEGDLCDSVNVTWTSSPSQTSATITYCHVSPQGSCMSVVCSSSPCTIQGVRRDREYEFTVLPTNNCGSASGCTGNRVTFTLGEESPRVAIILAAVVPSVVLIIVNIISVVVVFFLTRHCYKNTSKTSSPVKREDVYDQVQGGKTYEHIAMTDSPAYGPVK